MSDAWIGGLIMALIAGQIDRDGTAQDLRSLADVTNRRGGEPARAWLVYAEPTVSELAALGSTFSIGPRALDELSRDHRRSKLEQFGDQTLAVLRPARYLDAGDAVTIGELRVLAGPSFVVMVGRDGIPDLDEVRTRLDQSVQLDHLGSIALLYTVVGQVVEEYEPVLAGLENDLDEIEGELFGGGVAVTRRIYELTNQVIALQHATQPLADILRRLRDIVNSSGATGELDHQASSVVDEARHVAERIDAFRAALQNALTVNATLVGQAQNATSLRQNEEVKKISAWAAIGFAPTLIGTVYGMNFRHMPELNWLLGYPLALVMMVVASVLLYVSFKRRSWL